MTRPTFPRAVGEVLRDSTRACATLFKVMIPVVVAVKGIQVLGLVPYLAAPLAPVMALLGLPPQMGLVWATAMVNTIYGGLAVFGTLAAGTPLTEAQATVLGVLMLVAHALPIEVGIARAAGVRAGPILVLRVVGALVLGAATGAVYHALGWGQEPAVVLWQSSRVADPTPAQWAVGEVRNLGVVVVAVTTLMALLRLLEVLRVTHALHRALGPVFRLIGVGRKASGLTVVGLTLGISYGGGLIIAEGRSGRLPGRDVFFSLAFLGLCHSVFEDSLLMVLIGGSLPGLVVGRVLFAVTVMAVLVGATTRLCDRRFHGLLLTSAPPPTSSG